ncbi:S8 family serine peptidase [Streptomyces sp. NPDC048416]|uniref:S8 family serine peptidase n=1 Tax=Streptomyces sp. NPDC048416 TaxID=3365546 RepID=UPI003718AB36
MSRRKKPSSMTGVRSRRRAASVCAALGVWAFASGGLASQAAADGNSPPAWYLDSMRAPEMWKTSTGKGIKVAVVDTGVNPNTPSLRGQVLSQEVPQPAAYGATQDYQGHGTTMAELIAGTGTGGGIRGLAPDAKIIPVRIAMKTMKDTDDRTRTASAAVGIRAAADSDAKIINLSFGGATAEPGEREAVEYAVSKGKLVFAATGNDEEANGGVLEFPAAFPGVVGVGAADESGTVGKFSQSGNYVDLASPGLNTLVWCDTTFQKYCDASGTSAASAIASASAALIWSAHPTWTADQVLRTMIDTAGRSWDKDKPSKYLGYGLIRPRLVLEKPDIDPGPADVDPVSLDQQKSGTAPSSPAPPKGETVAVGAARGEGGGGSIPWVVAGVVAGIVLAGAGAFAATRSRRRGAQPDHTRTP